ncbi:MAG: hypothetical protein RMI91_10305 [Gemmatales bacterium]|nr:hypothetical protein [Gemmatales bacterium]MDW7995034.1 hypothetical protein [Gemmatales bacterium]
MAPKLRKALLLGILIMICSDPVSAQEVEPLPPESTGSTVNQRVDKLAPGSKPASSQQGEMAQLEARLEKLQAEVAQLNKTVAELKQHLSVLGQGLAVVDRSLDELRKDLAAVNTVLQQQMLAKRMEELQKEVAQLRELLKHETERLQSAIREVASAEVRKAFAPPLATAQIVVRNDWSWPVTVTVDNVTYTLQPGQEQRIYRAAGTFSYEVHGWQPLRTRTLAAGEQFLIRIALP